LARPFYERLGYRPTGPAQPRFGVLHVYPYEKRLQPDEALAHHEQQAGKPRCSFCKRSVPEIRFLVHGHHEARICNLCVAKFHGEIATQ
jgi:ClpX C4-type zinc finger